MERWLQADARLTTLGADCRLIMIMSWRVLQLGTYHSISDLMYCTSQSLRVSNRSQLCTYLCKAAAIEPREQPSSMQVKVDNCKRVKRPCKA